MKSAIIEDEKPHRALLLCCLEEWRKKHDASVTLETFESGEAFWFRYEEAQAQYDTQD